MEINIEQLQRALSIMGQSTPVSLEEMAINLPWWVNRLTHHVINMAGQQGNDISIKCNCG
jgi:hypothetical protein